MAIGGLPNIHNPQVNITKKATEVTVPIEKLDGTQGIPLLPRRRGQEFGYRGAPAGAAKSQYVVDTGTIPIILGEQGASAIGALFSPPAQKVGGSWFVYCNSTAPNLGVTIGGKTFKINPKDLVLDGGQTDQPDVCFSGIQGATSAGHFPPILGSVFLRNVLVVFDVGKAQMTFVAREYHEA